MNLNKEEGKYLEDKINEVDPGFENRVGNEIKNEEEIDKKLKENSVEFNNIQPKGRKEKASEEESSFKKSIVSKKSENKLSGVKKTEESKKSEAKKTEESKKSEVKKTEESIFRF